jgi:hypothetical protein
MGLGAEIIAIEDTDSVGWVESATTVGEVAFQSLTSFVDNVIAALGGRRLALLHIQVHGSPSGVWFGSDMLSDSNFSSFSGRLGRLTASFESGAWVDLRACEVGQNLPLLRRLHNLWGVGIVAGRGLQSNLVDANLGRYQVITPGGNEDTSFFVPPWVEYDTGRRATRAVTSRVANLLGL